MQPSRIIAILLGLNLGLLVLVGYLYHLLRTPLPAPPMVHVKTVAPRPSPPVRTSVVTNYVATNDFRWTQLESEDYRTYIRRLRDIGCPEQTLRDIIIADIDKMLARERLAASPVKTDLKYWQPDEKELESWRDYREWEDKERQIDFQKRDIIQELLGVDLVSERMRVRGQVDYYGRRLDFLPPDKRNEVRKLLETLAAGEVSIRQKTWEEGDALTPEDEVRLKELRQQHDTAVAAILSEEERKQYDLAMSPTAYAVRDALFGMNPTEKEFLALYGLRKGFETQWPEPPEGDPAALGQYTEAKAALEREIRAKLGDERYTEYVRAQDPDYRQLRIAAARYDIPEQAAADVYAFKQILANERTRLLAQETLTPQQKNTALQAMAAEAERAVQQALGEKAYRHYLRNADGAWIEARQLYVPIAPPTPPVSDSAEPVAPN